MTRADRPYSDRAATCLTAASIVRVAALTVPTDLTITPSAIQESFRMLTVQVPSADVSPESTALSSEGRSTHGPSAVAVARTALQVPSAAAVAASRPQPNPVPAPARQRAPGAS